MAVNIPFKIVVYDSVSFSLRHIRGYGHVVRDEPVLARASMASHFTVRCSA